MLQRELKCLLFRFIYEIQLFLAVGYSLLTY